MAFTFEDLVVYQRALDFAIAVVIDIIDGIETPRLLNLFLTFL